MTHTIAIVGAGGFGRETIDVIHAIAYATGTPHHIVAIDDRPDLKTINQLTLRGVEYIGTIERWLQTASADHFVITVGNPQLRESISNRIGTHVPPAPPLIHPTASVGSFSMFGPGTIVCAGANISTNVHTGAHTHINPGAIVGHDVTTGAYVSINPGAIISGGVRIDERTLVGAGATVLQELHLGEASTIGAASCVVRNTAPGSTVKGIPAR